MPVSTRLQARIRRDFPERGSEPGVVRIIDDLPGTAGYDEGMFGSERLQTAIVLLAEGSIHWLRRAIRLAMTDWRDVLVAVELAHEDWPDRLDAELGPEHPDRG
ncbi:hypothetical protein [Kitasatospora sp. NPDC093806]|uniref:hypothetical protein n=1 Tax=Kitasatospora sp. NPDC093806 TaxID=3155075 RepID=UPI0034154E07